MKSIKKSLLYYILAVSFLFSQMCYASKKNKSENIGSFDKEAFIAEADTEKVLELSIADCVRMALINNSEIKIKRIEPKIARDSLKRAKAVFEPSINAYYEYDETNEPGAMPTLTGNTKDMSRRKDYNIGLSGKLFTNTEYEINWDNYDYSSNSRLQRFFPDFNSSLSGSVTQPVLKDFLGMGEDQGNIVIAKNNMTISDCLFVSEVINVLSRVKTSYYDYVKGIDQYKVGELSLRRAQDLKKIIEKRHEKGLASSAELLEIEAEVAKKEEGLLFFERQLKGSEDEIKLVTNLVDKPEFWNAKINVKDKPEFLYENIGLVESIRQAFANRPDYKSAKADLRNKDVNIKLAKNSLLPTVDLVGTYEASGLGDKYSSAVDPIADGTYGSWSMGVSVKVPFGFAKEMSDYRVSKLEKEKAIIAFSRLEQNIILEVRNAVRDVDIAHRNIKAAEKTLEAESKTYDANKERFRSGMISTHDMIQYQEDYDRASLNRLAALIAYRKAQINLEKIKGTTLIKDNIVIEDF